MTPVTLLEEAARSRREETTTRNEWIYIRRVKSPDKQLLWSFSQERETLLSGSHECCGMCGKQGHLDRIHRSKKHQSENTREQIEGHREKPIEEGYKSKQEIMELTNLAIYTSLQTH